LKLRWNSRRKESKLLKRKGENKKDYNCKVNQGKRGKNYLVKYKCADRMKWK
jgi:hypothetical protein